MLLEIDFAKKKKKPAPPLATVMPLYPTEPSSKAGLSPADSRGKAGLSPADSRSKAGLSPADSRSKADSKKKSDEHLTLSI